MCLGVDLLCLGWFQREKATSPPCPRAKKLCPQQQLDFLRVPCPVWALRHLHSQLGEPEQHWENWESSNIANAGWGELEAEPEQLRSSRGGLECKSCSFSRGSSRVSKENAPWEWISARIFMCGDKFPVLRPPHHPWLPNHEVWLASATRRFSVLSVPSKAGLQSSLIPTGAKPGSAWDFFSF